MSPDTMTSGVEFYYKRCCRVHKLVRFYAVGRCGLCHMKPVEDATEAEYLSQPPL